MRRAEEGGRSSPPTSYSSTPSTPSTPLLRPALGLRPRTSYLSSALDCSEGLKRASLKVMSSPRRGSGSGMSNQRPQGDGLVTPPSPDEPPRTLKDRDSYSNALS
jgi:hypothetical protein